jgi:hypothetical protein
LREALQDAQDRNAQQLKVDRGFLEAILQTLDTRTSEFSQMRGKLDGMRVGHLWPFLSDYADTILSGRASNT